ncbi:hypothetical protein EVAR_16391_1 [Eumeta japonica]|uniref:Mariner Mos1 transposase n=1 Tax=Eumeta variegata TaxID=151549 RepID=A0A4C1VWT0_EUMVA|nr:hypothetical protein EVAR_16391_1 [Eumeta japonica]
MTETDKKVSYQQIRTSLSIGVSQLHEILHENIVVRNRWIPHNLNEAQKFRRVWCKDCGRGAGGQRFEKVINSAKPFVWIGTRLGAKKNPFREYRDADRDSANKQLKFHRQSGQRPRPRARCSLKSAFV